MTIPAYLAWAFVASFAIEIVGKTALIGVPREPITKEQAALTIVVKGALIVMFVLWIVR